MLPAPVSQAIGVPNSSVDVIEAKARMAEPSRGPDPGVGADNIDRFFHANLARVTGGLLPAAMALALADWQLHLFAAPGKRAELAGEALQRAVEFARAIAPHPIFLPWSLIKPPENDRRFSGSDW